MQHSKFAIMATLLSLSIHANSLITARQSSTPNADDIKSAVIGWRDDTGTVSSFLDNAAARSFKNNKAFHTAAYNAYRAEVDELSHKQVLDDELPASSQLQQANQTLVADRTFQSVVDLLEDLVNAKYNEKARIRSDLNKINFGHDGIAGRCAAVLPAIDTYFSQSSQELESLDGDDSLDGEQAIRPAACESSS